MKKEGSLSFYWNLNSQWSNYLDMAKLYDSYPEVMIGIGEIGFQVKEFIPI